MKLGATTKRTLNIAASHNAEVEKICVQNNNQFRNVIQFKKLNFKL